MMESPSAQGLSGDAADHGADPRRQGCVCSLSIGERFVLWALRQWLVDRALPMEGSALHRGFKMAGLLDALPDFAIAMDAFLFGARRALHVHRPPCPAVSPDEAMLVTLCSLAQADLDKQFMASLDVVMMPVASRVAGARLKAFTVALSGAGLALWPSVDAGGGRLN
jgi:hypothetical protein